MNGAISFLVESTWYPSELMYHGLLIKNTGHYHQMTETGTIKICVFWSSWWKLAVRWSYSVMSGQKFVSKIFLQQCFFQASTIIIWKVPVFWHDFIMAFKLYLKIAKNLPRIFLYYPKNLASVICPITFEYGEKHP